MMVKTGGVMILKSHTCVIWVRASKSIRTFNLLRCISSHSQSTKVARQGGKELGGESSPGRKAGIWKLVE